MIDAEVRAHAAIRKTLGACSQAGDARRAEAYAACFAEDGVLELAQRYEGRAAIHAWMSAPSVIPQPGDERKSPGYVSHHLTTCRIDLTGPGEAKVRTYWMVITANGLDHSGYYDDVFKEIAGDWLIAHRKPRTLWYAAESLVGTKA